MTREAKERLWFGFSLLYAVVRVLGASAFLEKYGLNIVVFAIIEIVSSSLLAIASAGMVRSIVETKLVSTILGESAEQFGVPKAPKKHHFRPNFGPLRRWALAVVVCFAAPDVYAYVATDHLPPALLAVIGIALLVSAVTSVVLITRKVRAARAQSENSKP
jgi:hypothetical protein